MKRLEADRAAAKAMIPPVATNWGQLGDMLNWYKEIELGGDKWFIKRVCQSVEFYGYPCETGDYNFQRRRIHAEKPIPLLRRVLSGKWSKTHETGERLEWRVYHSYGSVFIRLVPHRSLWPIRPPSWVDEREEHWHRPVREVRPADI